MAFHIRKIVTFKEIMLVEGGRSLATPITMTAVAAVIRNPWHGRGFVEDLRPEQLDGCAHLGKLMADQMVREVGDVSKVEVYGKSAAVGCDGEVEHASAVIHNLRFGNPFRKAMHSESFLSFTNKRGGPGTSIQIPMKHLHDTASRAHFVTLEFSIPDAPHNDEILIAIGTATGGRAHPRIGDRHLDALELQAEA